MIAAVLPLPFPLVLPMAAIAPATTRGASTPDFALPPADAEPVAAVIAPERIENPAPDAGGLTDISISVPDAALPPAAAPACPRRQRTEGSEARTADGEARPPEATPPDGIKVDARVLTPAMQQSPFDSAAQGAAARGDDTRLAPGPPARPVARPVVERSPAARPVPPAPRETTPAIAVRDEEPPRFAATFADFRIATPAPAPATDAIPHRPLDTGTGDWTALLAREIVAARPEDGPITFRLAPRHLGVVEVAVSEGAGGVVVHIVPGSEAGAALFAQEQPRLAEEFRQRGLLLAENGLHFGSNGDGRPGRNGAVPQPFVPFRGTDWQPADNRDRPATALRGRFA